MTAGGMNEFLNGCADEGLFLAPGPSFGPYPSHVRLCFTAAAPEVVQRGVDILARRLSAAKPFIPTWPEECG